MADYPSNSNTKRSAAVKVMLHPDMHEKLRVLAEHLGQTPSTLASIAVSQYVAQQTVALGATEKAVEGFFDRMAPSVLEALQSTLGAPKNALLDLAMTAPQEPARTNDLLKAFQQPQPPLAARLSEPLIGRASHFTNIAEQQAQKGKKK